MTTQFLAADIEREEGCKLTAYEDTRGLWTIGIGHHDSHVHAGMVWTEAEAQAQLQMDIQTAIRAILASPILQPVYAMLDDIRQDAFVQCCFQMGAATFAEFHMALGAMRSGDYDTAAWNMLDSDWARETPARAERMAFQIRTDQRAWANA